MKLSARIVGLNDGIFIKTRLKILVSLQTKTRKVLGSKKRFFYKIDDLIE